MERKRLSFNMCRRQDYESTMSGAYGGVKRFIQNMQPLTAYVHSAARDLNLVISYVLSSIRDVRVIFFFFLPQCWNKTCSLDAAYADGICSNP
jgi:hypothetical protein